MSLYFLSETPESSGERWLHQLGVASLVQDDVLRFEVSVDDSSRVQVGQSLDDASGVEPSGAVVERPPEKKNNSHASISSASSETTHTRSVPPVPQQRPQLSSQAGLQQHVQIFRVLEGPIQPAGRRDLSDLSSNSQESRPGPRGGRTPSRDLHPATTCDPTFLGKSIF